MKIIGITGGVACGKSTVCKILEEMGYKVLYTDKITEDVVNGRYDHHTKESIIRAFGIGAYKENARYDDNYISNIVYNDYDELRKLNTIVYPVVREVLSREMLYNKQQDLKDGLLFVECALIYEAGWHDMFNSIVSIKSNWKHMCNCLGNRLRSSENSWVKSEDGTDVWKVIDSQIDHSDKNKLAHFLIDNDYQGMPLEDVPYPFEYDMIPTENLKKLKRNVRYVVSDIIADNYHNVAHSDEIQKVRDAYFNRRDLIMSHNKERVENKKKLNNTMKIIGITGNIGCGKSTVCDYIRDMGYTVLSTDDIAKNVINGRYDNHIKAKIIKTFGTCAYKENVRYTSEAYDTEYMSNIVFNDPEKLKTLNDIVHPEVRSFLQELILEIINDNLEKPFGDELLFVECALIYEAGWEDMFDYIINISGGVEITLTNQQKNSNYLKIINTQLEQYQKEKRADYVIKNTLGLEELKIITELLIDKLKVCAKSDKKLDMNKLRKCDNCGKITECDWSICKECYIKLHPDPKNVASPIPSIVGKELKDYSNNEFFNQFITPICCNKSNEETPQKIAVYAGSFDPITKGHLDIISRARCIFDKVYVVVDNNSSKNYMFDADKRVEMVNGTIKQYLAEHIGRKIILPTLLCDGLVTDYAKIVNANYLIRGLRSGYDFEYEYQLAETNRELGNVETVFLSSKLELSHCSSSKVRELIKYNQDVSKYVIKPVLEIINKVRLSNG